MTDLTIRPDTKVAIDWADPNLDLSASAVLEEIARQGALLKGRPEEEEAIAFAEAVQADWFADHPE